MWIKIVGVQTTLADRSNGNLRKNVTVSNFQILRYLLQKQEYGVFRTREHLDFIFSTPYSIFI